VCPAGSAAVDCGMGKIKGPYFKVHTTSSSAVETSCTGGKNSEPKYWCPETGNPTAFECRDATSCL
jgi:hypothetical protein